MGNSQFRGSVNDATPDSLGAILVPFCFNPPPIIHHLSLYVLVRVFVSVGVMVFLWKSENNLHLEIGSLVHQHTWRPAVPRTCADSSVSTSHLTAGPGITDSCYHAQLYVGSGDPNSGGHTC